MQRQQQLAAGAPAAAVDGRCSGSSSWRQVHQQQQQLMADAVAAAAGGRCSSYSIPGTSNTYYKNTGI
jgi:hypothetical protein